MLINKRLLIFIFFFYLTILSPILLAKQIIGQDRVTFNLAVDALYQSDWQLAKSLLSSLHNDLPKNTIITNNLAVALFNLGELEKSQQLFASIIEQNKQTKNSYENLKKLYSYSAAKTYSTGLKLYKPISLPKMLVLNDKFNVIEGDKIKASPKQETLLISDRIGKQTSKPTKITKMKLKEQTELASLQVKDKNNINSPSSDIVKESKKIKEVKDILVAKKVNVLKPSIILDKPKVNKNSGQKKSNKEVLLTNLDKWRNAWVSGKVEKYVSMYKDNYSPRGKTRKAWIKNRQQKVTKSKKIKVTIKNAQVYINDSKTKANIRFNQSYSSRNYEDKVLKRLYWSKIDGQWLIDRESIIKTM